MLSLMQFYPSFFKRIRFFESDTNLIYRKCMFFANVYRIAFYKKRQKTDRENDNQIEIPYFTKIILCT